MQYWGLQIGPKNIKEEILLITKDIKWVYKKIPPLKVQIRKDQLQILSEFQRLEDIAYLQTTFGVTNKEISNLFQALKSDKDLNNHRE